MTAYCSTPAVLRLELTDPATGTVTQSLDLMDAAGSFRVESLELAWPAVREVKANLPTRDGIFDTTTLLGERVVTIVGSIIPAAGTARAAALNTLAGWAVPSIRPRLVYAVDAGMPTRQIGLRGQQLGAPFTNPAVSAFTVSWVAADPVAYSMVANAVTVTPGSTTLGRTYPLTFNRTYVTAGAGGTVNVTNAGSYPTWPTFKVFGPCTNPTINNVDPALGQIVTHDMTINAGDFVEIDTQAATVYYNGLASASRYDELDFGATLFAPFQPGTTGVQFVTATSSTGCHLEVDWSDAYLM